MKIDLRGRNRLAGVVGAGGVVITVAALALARGDHAAGAKPAPGASEPGGDSMAGMQMSSDG